MITIKSTSAEGTYYLVNGWNRYKTYWYKKPDPRVCGFKTAGLAIRSLNHLLKIMPEYAGDRFDLVRLNEQ